jgi:chromatin remodeling complex protein RSC6
MVGKIRVSHLNKNMDKPPTTSKKDYLKWLYKTISRAEIKRYNLQSKIDAAWEKIKLKNSKKKIKTHVLSRSRSRMSHSVPKQQSGGKRVAKRRVGKRVAKRRVAKRSGGGSKNGTVKRVTNHVAKQSGGKRKLPAALSKPLKPDAVLADIIGPQARSRAQLLKDLWGYFKKHKLNVGREINADAKVKKLAGKSKFTMFEVMKIMNQHIM